MNNNCVVPMRPVRDALDIINGKWKLPILLALLYQDKQFKDLKIDVEGITPRMLSKELRDLETNELIKRTVHDSIPVKVVYSLTDYGKTLDEVIVALKNWGEKHRHKLFTTT